MKIFSKKYNTPHWKKGAEIQNYGDFLSEYFHDKHFSDEKDTKCNVYHLVGSVISDSYVQKAKRKFKRIGFWSCGCRDYFSISEKNINSAHFFGVRGHLSGHVLNLPKEKVIGDSAFLLPFLLQPKDSPNNNKMLLIPHFSDQRSSNDLLSLYGGDAVLRTNIDNNFKSVEAVTQSICSASFILTSSLHGAIVAYAYGIPFALLNSGDIDCPFKWIDFMSTTGLPTQFVQNLDQGLEYSKSNPIKQKSFSVKRLIETCPFDVNLQTESLKHHSPLYL